MYNQKSKKLNSNRKLISVIAIAIAVFLAICVTFAWYTNRIIPMKGSFRLGSFGYQVSLYNVEMNNGTVSEVVQRGQTKTYTRQESDSWELPDEDYSNFASTSVKYQVIKVYNENSGFDIKAYEYLKYDNEMTAQQQTIANAFYFKPVKLNIGSQEDYSASEIMGYLNDNLTEIPAPDENPGGIASPETEITFGRIKDNAIALESGTISTGKYAYYLVGYCVTGLSDVDLDNSTYISVLPVITIGQANAPVPQSSAETTTKEVGTWPDLRSAIISANDGDTIRLTANVESPDNTDLNITKGINLDLNSYNLTVHGNVRFNYKTAEERSLILTAPSVLRADGNLIIETKGAFNIYSNVANDNILLGHKDNNENVIGGEFKANCGLYFNDEADSSGIKPKSVNEDSGLIINSVIIKSMSSTGTYANSTLKLIGSDTMIKVIGGAHLEKITYDNISIGNIYIANHGVINEIDFEKRFNFSQSNQVGLYIKNYNIVNSLTLPADAKGYVNGGTSAYNTRVIDNSGSATSFKNDDGVSTGDANDKYRKYENFKSEDVEPFGTSAVSNFVCDDQANGIYSLYLRNTNSNSDSSAEDLKVLFERDYPSHSTSNVKTLKVNTVGSVTLNTYHFHNDTGNNKYGIADLFPAIKKLDLSGTVFKDRTISNGAMQGYSSLNEIVFPTSNFGIGANAFAGTSVNKITLATNLDSNKGIGSGAFDVLGKIEVIWNIPTDIPPSYLDAFDSSKTLFFMEKTYSDRADTLYSEEWALDMYEFYDFKAKNNLYYCKYNTDGLASNGCEVIYFAGSLETISQQDDTNLVPYELSDGVANYNVVSINNHAFKKAIIADGSTNTVKLDLKKCLRVSKSAFEGTDNAKLKLSEFGLGSVNRIGSKAFKYNQIEYSAPRSESYTGMISLGERVFDQTVISGGILDLHGPSQKYTPSNYALAGLTFSGGYANGESGIAVLDLSNTASTPAQFTVGAKIYTNVKLNGINSIVAGAFDSSIYGNAQVPTNIVDIRDVKAIGSKAFNDIGCGVFRIGTYDNSLIDVVNPYTNIIGSGEIETLELYGSFSTSEAPALASDSASDSLVIDNLRIVKHTVNDELQTTVIPDYAFAGADGSHNITINAVTVDKDVIVHPAQNEEDEPTQETIYASYNIGEAAFKNADLPTTEVTVESTTTDYYYNFRGVVNVGSQAFYGSTVKNLGLGTSVETIANWNFIKNCDKLKNLRIEKVGSIVTLNGGTADPNLKSDGTELSGFKISVSTSLLTGYVSDTAWSGWKNYFGALYYTVLKNYNATAQSSAHALKWYYNVIDPDHLEKGAQIVKCEPVYVFEGEQVEPLYYTSKEAITYRYTGSGARRKNYQIEYYSYSITVPKTVTNPFDDSTTLAVTQLGAEEDIFEGVEYGEAYGFNSYGSLEDFLEHGNTLRENVDLRFELNLGDVTEIKYISAPAISSDKIKNFNLGSNTNSKYTVVDNNQLYYRINNVYQFGNQSAGSNNFSGEFAHLELVKVLPAYSSSTFTVKREVEVIQKGAFQGCDNIETINLQAPVAGSSDTNFNPRLMYIEADAFKDAENISEFDFTNTRNFISIGADVFGEARKLEVNESAHYQYTALTDVTIKIPDSSANQTIKELNNTYKNSGMYYFYNYYGLIVDSNVDNQGGSVNSNSVENTKLSLKKKEYDETLSGVSYHLMTSGSEYNSNVYLSDKSQFIAVVTGLSEETAKSSTVVIPSTVVVKGISYDVIAIADNAFGTNEWIQTLVLPSKNVIYSSAALAGCENLGIIQYNDIIPFTESTNTVAALPTPSAKSLIENSNDEEEKG